jgi:hypothetical protein
LFNHLNSNLSALLQELHQQLGNLLLYRSISGTPHQHSQCRHHSSGSQLALQ